ncbi:hypothetical protein Desde_3159 [Desulfitobacterium dehalogenans ATCC 51507]|uniref:Uncharacterized protein n=1 Tax=Desulfitobacterium dehalogenans (strain ATCC 51507 / DSM 9161 / JW/IU-DC1) TaxID=756499 RepID=I4ABW5_DESDJ|nr:hypothetical protein [Desulfitobacterium dehalogenans]AFM01450.1 hypothetical protein Desde_3159 [Desulfitobacterium dehalogenans ATCC 51507]
MEKKFNLTRQGKLVILGVLVVFVIALAAMTLVQGKGKEGSQQEFNLKDVPAQGVIADANYRLVPVLDAAADKAARVYIDTEAIPALFFATWDESSAQVIIEIQNVINQMGSTPHKPLVLVSTFAKTTDQNEAKEMAKGFQQENNISLPMTVQVGPPTEFVQQSPSFVFTDNEGTHIITEQNKIIESLSNALSLPVIEPEIKTPSGDDPISQEGDMTSPK